MDLIKEAMAVANYVPQNVKQEDGKIWFCYTNKDGAAVPAFYEFATRKFKSVIFGKQYGKDGVAVRNLIARPVVESIFG